MTATLTKITMKMEIIKIKSNLKN